LSPLLRKFAIPIYHIEAGTFTLSYAIMAVISDIEDRYVKNEKEALILTDNGAIITLSFRQKIKLG